MHRFYSRVVKGIVVYNLFCCCWIGGAEVAPILLVEPSSKEMLVGLLVVGVLLLVEPNLEGVELEHRMRLVIC
jgi:hypothetical protein